MVFDPWTTTIEQAIAADSEPHGRPPYASPIFQWQAAQTIASQEEKVAAGDGYAVMFCAHLCAWHELVMPRWLAKEFMRRFRRVNRAEVRTWDEAFGSPNPGKVNLAAVRRRRRSRVALQEALIQVLRRGPPGVAIDRLLWEAVGKVIGESGGQTEKLYQQNIRNGGGFWMKAEDLRDMHAGAEWNYGNERSHS